MEIWGCKREISFRKHDGPVGTSCWTNDDEVHAERVGYSTSLHLIELKFAHVLVLAPHAILILYLDLKTELDSPVIAKLRLVGFKREIILVFFPL